MLLLLLYSQTVCAFVCVNCYCCHSQMHETVNPHSTYQGVSHPLHVKILLFQPIDWEEVLSSLEVDRGVGEVDWAQPGTSAGMAMLESFIDQRLRFFATHRNNPNCDALSHLSPWLHTGQSVFSFVYAIKVNVFQCHLDAVKRL